MKKHKIENLTHKEFRVSKRGKPEKFSEFENPKRFEESLLSADFNMNRHNLIHNDFFIDSNSFSNQNENFLPSKKFRTDNFTSSTSHPSPSYLTNLSYSLAPNPLQVSHHLQISTSTPFSTNMENTEYFHSKISPSSSLKNIFISPPIYSKNYKSFISKPDYQNNNKCSLIKNENSDFNSQMEHAINTNNYQNIFNINNPKNDQYYEEYINSNTELQKQFLDNNQTSDATYLETQNISLDTHMQSISSQCCNYPLKSFIQMFPLTQKFSLEKNLSSSISKNINENSNKISTPIEQLLIQTQEQTYQNSVIENINTWQYYSEVNSLLSKLHKERIDRQNF